jgi:hypothetical protein
MDGFSLANGLRGQPHPERSLDTKDQFGSSQTVDPQVPLDPARCANLDEPGTRSSRARSATIAIMSRSCEPWFAVEPILSDCLLAERGIDISHETVRFWWNRLRHRPHCKGTMCNLYSSLTKGQATILFTIKRNQCSRPTGTRNPRRRPFQRTRRQRQCRPSCCTSTIAPDLVASRCGGGDEECRVRPRRGNLSSGNPLIFRGFNGG